MRMPGFPLSEPSPTPATSTRDSEISRSTNANEREIHITRFREKQQALSSHHAPLVGSGSA
jgi:hypothetical protein